MTFTNLARTGLGVALVMVASIVGNAGRTIEARQQAIGQVPVVSEDPVLQRQIEAQLASAASLHLDPNARIASLSLTARPLREILDAVAQAGGMTLRYPLDMTSLDTSSSVTLSEEKVEDALRAVLEAHALTFEAMGPKTAFVYPDTAANREKYTASIRAFPLATADPTMLAQQLTSALRPSLDGLRVMVLAVQDSRTVVVRAIPELMSWIATWIAEHDRD